MEKLVDKDMIGVEKKDNPAFDNKSNGAWRGLQRRRVEAEPAKRVVQENVQETVHQTEENTAVKENEDAPRKNRKAILIFSICAVIVIGLIITIVAQGGPYDGEYRLKGCFDKNDSQEIELKGLKAYVPSDWKTYDPEESYVYTEVFPSDSSDSVAFFQVDYLGEMDSEEKLKEKTLEDYGEGWSPIKTKKYDAAYENEYLNTNDWKLYGWTVLVDGKGYWIGGGSEPLCYDKKTIKKMIKACNYKK